MIELTVPSLLAIFGIPTALTSFCFWFIEKQIKKNDKIAEARENTREKMMLIIVKGNTASIALSEATARAVQRIPDAHCNGDMHKALEYAENIKTEQKEFFEEQGIKAMFD